MVGGGVLYVLLVAAGTCASSPTWDGVHSSLILDHTTQNYVTLPTESTPTVAHFLTSSSSSSFGTYPSLDTFSHFGNYPSFAATSATSSFPATTYPNSLYNMWTTPISSSYWPNTYGTGQTQDWSNTYYPSYYGMPYGTQGTSVGNQYWSQHDSNVYYGYGTPQADGVGSWAQYGTTGPNYGGAFAAPASVPLPLPTTADALPGLQERYPTMSDQPPVYPPNEFAFAPNPNDFVAIKGSDGTSYYPRIDSSYFARAFATPFITPPVQAATRTPLKDFCLALKNPCYQPLGTQNPCCELALASASLSKTVSSVTQVGGVESFNCFVEADWNNPRKVEFCCQNFGLRCR